MVIPEKFFDNLCVLCFQAIFCLSFWGKNLKYFNTTSHIVFHKDVVFEFLVHLKLPEFQKKCASHCQQISSIRVLDCIAPRQEFN